MNTSEIRTELADALLLDLIGPDNKHVFTRELLPEPPSIWYLSGFLVPTDAPVADRSDVTADDDLEGSEADDEGATDDGTPPDSGAARRSLLPSSMGLSVLVEAGVKKLDAVVEWGDYLWEDPQKSEEPGEDGAVARKEQGTAGEGEPSTKIETSHGTATAPRGYRREPCEERVTVELPDAGAKAMELTVPNSAGLRLSVTVRQVVASTARLPAGTRSVSVFLVNRRRPHEQHRYRTFAFQASLRLVSPEPFVPRPDLRGTLGGAIADEWDERVADLQYRDVFEYAVGHGVSATTEYECGACRVVKTTWIPRAEVERVAPSSIADVELKMEALGALTDPADAQT
jgi:hypothetical protein